MIGLILNGIEGLRRFDQCSDVLPLYYDDDHDHQYNGYQRHFVNILILHARNVWQFFADANALLGLANERSRPSVPRCKSH